MIHDVGRRPATMSRESVSESDERLDRLAGDGQRGGGMPLPLLFGTILDQLQEHGPRTADELQGADRGRPPANRNGCRCSIPTAPIPWRDYTLDGLEQLASRGIVARDGERWRLGPKFVGGERMRVIERPRRANRQKSASWSIRRARRRAREADERRKGELISLAASLRPSGPGLRPVEPEHVAALAESMRAFGYMEAFPVLVDLGGRILDGRHRMAAARQAGVEVTEQLVPVSDRADALAVAWLANEGRPWSPDDRKRIAELMTAKDGSTAEVAKVLSRAGRRALIEARLREHPEWSDRLIASKLGCDHKTAAAVRRQLEATGEIPQSDRLLGDDGRWYENKRRPAAQPSEAADIAGEAPSPDGPTAGPAAPPETVAGSADDPEDDDPLAIPPHLRRSPPAADLSDAPGVEHSADEPEEGEQTEPPAPPPTEHPAGAPDPAPDAEAAMPRPPSDRFRSVEGFLGSAWVLAMTKPSMPPEEAASLARELGVGRRVKAIVQAESMAQAWEERRIWVETFLDQLKGGGAADRAGVSYTPAAQACRAIEAETAAGAAPMPDFSLSMSAQQKLDAAIAAHKRKLDREFEQRVREGVAKWREDYGLNGYAKKIEELRRMFTWPSNSVMTKQEYAKNSDVSSPGPDQRVDDRKHARGIRNLYQVQAQAGLGCRRHRQDLKNAAADPRRNGCAQKDQGSVMTMTEEDLVKIRRLTWQEGLGTEIAELPRAKADQMIAGGAAIPVLAPVDEPPGIQPLGAALLHRLEHDPALAGLWATASAYANRAAAAPDPSRRPSHE